LKKLRVHELAKDFGIKGPDMAKLLREQLGFENIKSHMTVLEPADEIMVVGRLEASGYRRKPAGETAVAEAGPAMLRKKALPAETPAEPAPAAPKKKMLREAPPPEPAPEPEPVEAQVAEAAEAREKEHDLPKKQLPRPVARRTRKADAESEAPAEAEALQAEAGAVAEAAEAPAARAEVEMEAPPEASVPTAPAPPARRPEPVAAPQEPEPRPARAEQAPPSVRKLLLPKAKAQVVGRIELPQETIRDATRRSAPAPERNVGRDLRRAALKSTQQRTATRVSTPGRGRQSTGRTGRDQKTGPRRGGKSAPTTTIDPNKEIEIEAPVSIKAFSEALGVKVTELIATLTFKLNVPGKNINSFLNQDEVELVSMELDRKVVIVESKQAEEEMIEQLVEVASGETQHARAPVVTFMGHVDHGKTSLIDRLRQSDIAKGEAGGITQHIGAYKVTTDKGQSFVILDTPGHAAFTAMRARGANITDIVVLVVAADDGVMPQTEEAISHAKAANVPIVVAINKCDLPGANPMQVKQQLMVKGLQSEEWGGKTGMVEVSAVTGKGIDDLVDRIMLEADINLELRARPEAAGSGIVIESKQSPEQGVVVTVLVMDGTLRTKDQIVCGESFARVRGMVDDHGHQVTEAGPATPVTVFGMDRLPMPGDKLFVVEDAKKAREVVETRQRRARDLSLAERSAVTLETLSAKLAEQEREEIKIILKADVMGSLEPLRKELEGLSTSEVRVNLLHTALGGINESDVRLAETYGAVIVGFNTLADSSARQAAERGNVEIRYYDVIYKLLDDVRAAMEGLLSPQEVETIIGHAEVRALFKSSKVGTIAGCFVTDGVIKRNVKVRLARDGKVVHTGKVATLRREKDDVREVRAGFECGLTLQDYQDIKEGDVLEFMQVEMVKRTLGSV
jgi:translation initiation factor IF-2